MNYEQLSKEAQRLIDDGWFKNFEFLEIIYIEIQYRILK